MIQQSGLTKSQACEASEISRSNYYRWKRAHPPTKDITLRMVMQEIALEFTRYGYRRITKELQRRGWCVNHKRVLRIMKEDNLICLRKQFAPKTTNSNHGYVTYPNLATSLHVTDRNQLWVADITYIRLRDEFVYLAVILDVYSRKCIGWELSRSIDTQLTLDALHQALATRKSLGFSNLVHHTDQGVQYAATAYVECLKAHGITISMSRKGNPKDNAFAESFMKTLKVEEVYLNDYATFEEAHDNLGTFIEEIYNTKRLHSGMGYLPPNEFEQKIEITP